MEPRTTIIITGLPASGKSTYGYELAKNLNYLLMDESTYDSIADHSHHFNLIVICASFCLKQNRERITKLLSKNITVKWIAFENDPIACWKNSQVRSKLTTHSNNHDFFKLSKLYTYPKNCEIIPVWN